jgi:hypothetical protein
MEEAPTVEIAGVLVSALDGDTVLIGHDTYPAAEILALQVTTADWTHTAAIGEFVFGAHALAELQGWLRALRSPS